RFEGGDIDEIGGPIALGIAAEIDFVEVERELFAKSGPGAKRQRCTGAVIKVRVDRPLREDDIRLNRREKLGELFIACRGNLRRAVHLRGKDRMRFDTFVSRLGLGGADVTRFSRGFAVNVRLSAREIEAGNVVAGARVARDRSAAPG